MTIPVSTSQCSLFTLCDTYTLLSTQCTDHNNSSAHGTKLSTYNTRILHRLQKLNTTAGRRWTQSLQRYQYIYHQQLLCSKTIFAAQQYCSLYKLQEHILHDTNNQICFPTLPIELNIYILSLLLPIDVCNAIQVCRHWCLFILSTHTSSVIHAHQQLNRHQIKCETLIHTAELNVKLPNAHIADSLYVLHTLDAALTLHRRNVVLHWSERIGRTLASTHNKSKQQLCTRVWHLAVYIIDLYRLQLNRTDNELQLDVVCALMISANALLASNRGAVLTADQCSYLLDQPV